MHGCGRRVDPHVSGSMTAVQHLETLPINRRAWQGCFAVMLVVRWLSAVLAERWFQDVLDGGECPPRIMHGLFSKTS